MDSSHTSCAEKCFGLLFKFECSPKLRFQALYSLTFVSFFYFLQTQFSVSLKVFTLEATLKTRWFCEDPAQTLNLEMTPDLICPNASLNQVNGARAKFIFKGALCSQFLLRRFYLCSCTGIFNIWLGLPVLHSWVYDRLSEADFYHLGTNLLLFCCTVGKSPPYHIKNARNN